MPWTLKDPERGSQGAFHCETCQATVPEETRADMHCGFIDERRWPMPGSVPKHFGGEAYTVDVCPGWLVRQPAVVEGVEAYAAMEAGVLGRYDPIGVRAVDQAALAAKSAFARFEAHKQRQMQDRMRRT